MKKKISSKKITSLLKKMPKTELHLHLEGMVRKETIFLLCKKNPQNTVIRTMKDVYALFSFGSNLSDFIHAFIVLQDNIICAEDFEYLMKDLKRYVTEHNIIYAEVFLAISTPLRKGLLYRDIISVLERSVKKFEKNGSPRIRFIVDVSRSFGPENAMHNLNEVLKRPSKYVVGIGLGGDESHGAAADYKAVFSKAAKHGLHLVSHAGEDAGKAKGAGEASIRASLALLKSERIGHGVAAMKDVQLMKELAQKKVPIEICVSSNVFTRRYISKASGHPAKIFYKHGMLLTINSDDPTFFDTDITREYQLFYKELGFSIDELIALRDNGITASFHPNKEKLLKDSRIQTEKLLKKMRLTG